MAHTAGELRSVIAGFMHRDPAVFVRPAITGSSGYLTDENGVRILDADGNAIVMTLPGCGQIDLLYNAMNNARLYAERRVDFEYSRVDVKIPVSDPLVGGSLDNAVLRSDGVTAVAVKKIRTPFIVFADNQQYPIDLWSRKKWDDKTKRAFESASANLVQNISPQSSTSQWWQVVSMNFAPVLVQTGKVVYVAPQITQGVSYDVCADVLQWLPDYVNGTETDFLLDFSFDWLMYRSIYELNFFLKEDERVQLSMSFVKDAWDAMVMWNNELIAANVDDVDLN